MRYKHFSKSERLELSILLKKGYSIRSIASVFGKSPSSVSREMGRNKVHGVYAPDKADHKAYARRYWSKYQGMKVKENPAIEAIVRKYIQPPYRWSPEKIIGRFKLGVRPDTVYKYLYSRYGYGLTDYLRYKHGRRHHRKETSAKRALIPQRISIHERPSCVSGHQFFGHAESDTMGRPQTASPETLVVVRELVSRKLFGQKVPRLAHSMEGFKSIQESEGFLSMTFDNGVENMRHRELAIPTYFCDPYSSWQKGSVEQGIGLIRIYIPKKADLKNYSQEDIHAILDHINSTPMKCLGFKTPNEVYEELSLQANRSACCT